MELRICILSLACVRIRGGESKGFRIDSGVSQGCIMSPWLFNVYMKVKMGMSFLEVGREWRFLGLLHADELVLCGDSGEDLREMVGRFIEACRSKSKCRHEQGDGAE